MSEAVHILSVPYCTQSGKQARLFLENALAKCVANDARRWWRSEAGRQGSWEIIACLTQATGAEGCVLIEKRQIQDMTSSASQLSRGLHYLLYVMGFVWGRGWGPLTRLMKVLTTLSGASQLTCLVSVALWGCNAGLLTDHNTIMRGVDSLLPAGNKN